MNKNIQHLYQIAKKDNRLIVGLMSGTSFDGLDVALCNIAGSGRHTRVKVLHFITKSYDAAFKEDLKSIFARSVANLQQVVLLNEYIGTYHAELVSECLEEWQLHPAEIDLIASHGQTIFHAPKRLHGIEKFGNGTLQIGDGDHIAVNTGVITLSDFRQKHIAAGGEGAPLAFYGDYLMFSDVREDRIMLNIGGIANFTYLPANGIGGFSTDTGTGNTMMDQFIQQHYPGRYYDKNGEIAASGSVDTQLLEALLDHPFFTESLPKTTGPELFGLAYLQQAQKQSGQADISNQDILATLAKFTAEGIIKALKTIATYHDARVYISGGGMYNPVVKGYLEGFLNRKIYSTADLGIHPDAKEAVLFAVLANEAVAGGDTDYGAGVPAAAMGKISFPQ